MRGHQIGNRQGLLKTELQFSGDENLVRLKKPDPVAIATAVALITQSNLECSLLPVLKNRFRQR